MIHITHKHCYKWLKNERFFKNTVYSTLKKHTVAQLPSFALLFILLCFPLHLFSAASFTSGNSAAALASAIQGAGITITNPQVRSSKPDQVGKFSNGTAGANLQINEGIILTTMDVAHSFQANSSPAYTVTNGNTYTDPDLLSIDPNARFDTVIFEFDVTLDDNTRLLLVDYQFASEEYPEYVGSVFNDSFGFFISGGDLNQTYNIARVVDNSVQITTENIQNYAKVTINSVNGGVPGAHASGAPSIYTNSAYYINNATKSVTVEYDGMTKRLQAVLDNLTPGQTYHFKMAIADASDAALDSAVFVNKIVGVREPKFCYDYAYDQNKIYFTEPNSGSLQPRIQGHIVPNTDINVSLYLKNIKNSDVFAKDFSIDILDINTSQALYKYNSVYVTNPNQSVPNKIPDASLASVSTSNVKGIPINNIGDQQSIYTYYALNPVGGLSDINISLNAVVNYTVDFDIGGGKIIHSPRKTKIGSSTIPMCEGDITKYEPNWGTFNVAAKGIYDANHTYPKFNIPTQVVKRPGEFLITAHDANSTPVPYIRELAIPTVVGIELIDASKFHNTQASCNEPASAVSERFWVPFVTTAGARSQVDLKTALQNAITQNIIPISNIKDYFKDARRNMVFRITANVGDDNNTIIKYQELSGGKYRMMNFTELVNTTYNTCKQPVKTSPSGGFTTQVSVACGGAGTTGLNLFELNRCQECILGYKTVRTCSRDNFAVRPESFYVQLRDLNQTNHSQTQLFATDRTGIVNPSTDQVHMAARYAYRLDINATNHEDNAQSLGYTRYFNDASSDHNMSFIWNPLLPTNPNTYCNDKNSTGLSFDFINGTGFAEANLTNVGEYRLNVIDHNWTVVDNDSARMSHHKQAKIGNSTINVSNYFVGSGNALDCWKDNAFVQKTVTLPSISGSSLANINGCIITTQDHNNTDTNIKYRDYNIFSHPYQFLLAGVIPSHGMDANNTFGRNAWVYMNDINHAQDINESMHFRGDIIAAGFNGQRLSNFVAQCYARDINVTLDYNVSRNTDLPDHRYRLINRDLAGNNISAIPSLNLSPAQAFADGNTTIVIADGNFTKTLTGAARIDLNLNFDRNISRPVNPIRVGYEDINATCNDAVQDCQMQADLRSTFQTRGIRDVNSSLTYLYGRVYSTDYRGPSPINDTTIRYEAYCTNSVTGYAMNCLNDFNMTTQSPLSVTWFRNFAHTNRDGNVTNFASQGGGTVIANFNTSTINTGLDNNHSLSLAGGTAAPYTDTIRMTPSPWLLFNLTNPNAITNDFIVEFTALSGWSGEGNVDRVEGRKTVGSFTNDQNVTHSTKKMNW